MSKRKNAYQQKPKAQARSGSAPRTCLMCGGTFDSEGIHNRVCKRCKGTQAWREGKPSADYAA